MSPTVQARSAILAFAALGCTTLALMPPSRSADRSAAADRATAALAWAKAKCWPSLQRTPSSSRIQAEDLMTVSADLDAAARRFGAGRACSEAIAIALPALATARVPPVPVEAIEHAAGPIGARWPKRKAVHVGHSLFTERSPAGCRLPAAWPARIARSVRISADRCEPWPAPERPGSAP